MTGLKQSVSLGTLAVALGCLATPALAQEVGGLPSDQPSTSPPPKKVDKKAKSGAKTVKASEALSTSDVDNASDIIVTGTHITRPNMTSTAPIVSIGSREIEEQGAINVSDILNRLPQVAPDNQQTYQDSNGAQQVQLRGLGFNRTLSLIDGLRIATSEGVNVNSIPVQLIDRIDVLTGGAASVYGADAVAGVINFVLKKDFTGFAINSSYSLYNHDNNGDNLGARTARAEGYSVPHGGSNDGGTGNLNIAWGGRFLGDRLKIQAYFGYLHSDPILVSDRDFSSCYLTQNGARNTAPTCTLSTTAPYQGVFTPQTGPNAGTTFSNADDGSRTFVPTGPNDSYRAYQSDYLQHADTRYNAGTFINFEISPHISLYATYMMSYDTTYDQYGPVRLFNSADYGLPQATYTLNCNNPLLSGQQATILCGGNAGTAATVPVSLRYGFNTTERLQYNNFDQRATAGFRGSILDGLFKYDGNFVYSRAETQERGAAVDSTPSYANLENALNGCTSGAAGCVPLDVFTTGNSSQRALDYIFGTTRGKSSNTGSLFDYTVNLTGDFGKLGIRSPFAREGLIIAAGGEYRVDKEVNNVDAAEVEEEGGGDFSLHQNVKEAYLEANLPLVQDKPFAHELSATGSYRWSKYQISPKTFTTWQVGGIYAPVEDMTFRVSYNKASRQPTVYEYGPGVFQYVGGSSDPCAGTLTASSPNLQQCENTGVTAAEYGHIPQCDNNSCLARNEATHPNPETAHTLTYGVILKPRFIPGLIVSVDRHDITIDDQIGFAYDSSFMTGCLDYGIPFYCDHVHRNADGSLTSADLYRPGTTPSTGFVTYGNSNQYKFTNKGYDVQGEYTLPVAAIHGKLDFIFNGTLTTAYGGQDSPAVPVRNTAGYFDVFAGIPRPKWSHTLRSTYTNDGGFSVSLNWRHIGHVTDTANSGDPSLVGSGNNVFQHPLTLFAKIPNYDYFDLSTSVTINHKLTLTLLANNLFDRLPPILPDSYNQNLSRANTIPQTYDALGRFIQVAASIRF